MAKSRTIFTERLKITPFSSRFLTGKYVSWLNDPEVMKYSEGRFYKHNIESCREYMLSYRNSPSYFWAIVGKYPKLGHIGNINAIVDERYMTADVGILIGEKASWGRGYGREAFASIIDFLFREASMRKVTAGTISSNKPMLNIMKSIGMECDGIRKRQYLNMGREVDVIYMSAFRNDWMRKRRTK